MRQRVERPVRHGRDRVRQHAHALGSLHQDDGEGEGRGCTTGKGFWFTYETVYKSKVGATLCYHFGHN